MSSKFKLILSKTGTTTATGEDILESVLTQVNNELNKQPTDSKINVARAIRFLPETECNIKYKTPHAEISNYIPVKYGWTTDLDEIDYKTFQVQESGIAYSIDVGFK